MPRHHADHKSNIAGVFTCWRDALLDKLYTILCTLSDIVCQQNHTMFCVYYLAFVRQPV